MKSLMTSIEDELSGMVKRANAMQTYLNRVVYRQYQNAQRQRWQTENTSEGQKWKPLKPGYAKSKLRRFADYPGAGRKMMIATKRLFDAVVGPSSEHRKTTTAKSIEIGWATPYAEEVDSVRNFSEFGQKTMDEIYDGLGEFIMEGIFRRI